MFEIQRLESEVTLNIAEAERSVKKAAANIAGKSGFYHSVGDPVDHLKLTQDKNSEASRLISQIREKIAGELKSKKDKAQTEDQNVKTVTVRQSWKFAAKAHRAANEAYQIAYYCSTDAIAARDTALEAVAAAAMVLQIEAERNNLPAAPADSAPVDDGSAAGGAPVDDGSAAGGAPVDDVRAQGDNVSDAAGVAVSDAGGAPASGSDNPDEVDTGSKSGGGSTDLNTIKNEAKQILHDTLTKILVPASQTANLANGIEKCYYLKPGDAGKDAAHKEYITARHLYDVAVQQAGRSEKAANTAIKNATTNQQAAEALEKAQEYERFCSTAMLRPNKLLIKLKLVIGN